MSNVLELTDLLALKKIDRKSGRAASKLRFTPATVLSLRNNISSGSIAKSVERYNNPEPRNPVATTANVAATEQQTMETGAGLILQGDNLQIAGEQSATSANETRSVAISQKLNSFNMETGVLEGNFGTLGLNFGVNTKNGFIPKALSVPLSYANAYKIIFADAYKPLPQTETVAQSTEQAEVSDNPIVESEVPKIIGTPQIIVDTKPQQNEQTTPEETKNEKTLPKEAVPDLQVNEETNTKNVNTEAEISKKFSPDELTQQDDSLEQNISGNWKKLFDDDLENTESDEPNKTEPVEGTQNDVVSISENKVTDEELAQRRLIGQFGDKLKEVRTLQKNVDTPHSAGLYETESNLLGMLYNVTGVEEIAKKKNNIDDKSGFKNYIEEVTGYTADSSQQENKGKFIGQFDDEEDNEKENRFIPDSIDVEEQVISDEDEIYDKPNKFITDFDGNDNMEQDTIEADGNLNNQNAPSKFLSILDNENEQVPEEGTIGITQEFAQIKEEPTAGVTDETVQMQEEPTPEVAEENVQAQKESTDVNSDVQIIDKNQDAPQLQEETDRIVIADNDTNESKAQEIEKTENTDENKENVDIKIVDNNPSDKENINSEESSKNDDNEKQSENNTTKEENSKVEKVDADSELADNNEDKNHESEISYIDEDVQGPMEENLEVTDVDGEGRLIIDEKPELEALTNTEISDKIKSEAMEQAVELIEYNKKIDEMDEIKNPLEKK